jgi:acyl carrier protein
MPDNIEARVKAIIAHELDVDEAKLTSTARILELMGEKWPRVTIVLALELEYDLRIPEDELDRLFTVGDFVDYIRSRVSN